MKDDIFGNQIGLCSDHAGFELKEMIKGFLEAHDVSCKDYGTYSAESCDYADFAHKCADGIIMGNVKGAIAMCGTGNGIAMSLNHHNGIRAALCWTKEIAELARKHNDANVLVLPARFISASDALNIVDVFLSTEFEGGRHARRIAKIDVLS